MVNNKHNIQPVEIDQMTCLKEKVENCDRFFFFGTVIGIDVFTFDLGCNRGQKVYYLDHYSVLLLSRRSGLVTAP